MYPLLAFDFDTDLAPTIRHYCNLASYNNHSPKLLSDLTPTICANHPSHTAKTPNPIPSHRLATHCEKNAVSTSHQRSAQPLTMSNPNTIGTAVCMAGLRSPIHTSTGPYDKVGCESDACHEGHNLKLGRKEAAESSRKRRKG